MPTLEKQDPNVVARAWTSSPGRRRRCLSAEVWGVCEKTPLLHGTHRRTDIDVVTRVHAFSLGHRRHRPGGYGFARAPTAVVARRRLTETTGVLARAGPVCARTSQGIKGPAFPSLLTLLSSEAFGLDLSSSSSLREPHR